MMLFVKNIGNVSNRRMKIKYDKAPRISSTLTSKLSSGARLVLTYLYEIYNMDKRLSQDEIGLYVQVARTVLANYVGVTVKTVIGYVRELVRAGVIADRRVGNHKLNKIYFCNLNEDDLYGEESTEQEDTVIVQARTLIANLSKDKLKEKNIVKLLKLCNNDIEEFAKAVEYCEDKEIRTSVFNMLKDTLTKKYYNTSNKPPVSIPKQQKNGRYTNILKHEVDYDKLELMDRWLVDMQTGNMTQEEYESKINELSKK